jgi:hypothetical protein
LVADHRTSGPRVRGQRPGGLGTHRS